MAQKTLISDLSINNGKLEGFFRGVVEDNNCPDGNGACRVRIFGVHSANKDQTDDDGIPTDHLTWAQQVTGLGGNATSSVPKIGAYVFLFFENGNPSQPRYFGIAPGTEKGNPDVVKPDTNSYTPEGQTTPDVKIDDSVSYVGVLNRVLSNDEGTRGTLTISAKMPDGSPGLVVFQCKTLELPWRNNAKGKSCFPKGTYNCVYTSSNRSDLCKTYIINGTPGRDGCRMHKWWYAGDKALGYQSHVEGCVLLGDSLTENANNNHGKRQVKCENGSAVTNLPIKLKQQPFTLTVTGVVG